MGFVFLRRENQMYAELQIGKLFVSLTVISAVHAYTADITVSKSYIVVYVIVCSVSIIYLSPKVLFYVLSGV